jgi:hypothetical protein
MSCRIGAYAGYTQTVSDFLHVFVYSAGYAFTSLSINHLFGAVNILSEIGILNGLFSDFRLSSSSILSTTDFLGMKGTCFIRKA